MKKLFIIAAIFCAAFMTSCKNKDMVQCWLISWENKETGLKGSYYFWGSGDESDEQLKKIAISIGPASKIQVDLNEAQCKGGDMAK